MSLNHPLVGIEWIVTFILMVIIIILRERGYRPVSLYGLILGGFVSWSSGYFGEYPLNFDVESFMYMLLPPIVLQSGLHFNWNQVKDCWGTALAMAWIGTMITASWVGYAVYIMHDISYFILALWIGGIVGPTDAVSTKDCVKELDKKTKMVLEYESVLNDAVSIIIVHICQRLWFNTIEVDSKDILEIIGINLSFLVISILIGISCAYIATKIFMNTTIVFVLALISYAFCECIGSSGIISIFSFGIVFQYLCKEEYLKKIKIVSDALAEFSETYIYISIGVIVTLTEFKFLNIAFTVALACFTSRIISVFLVTKVASFFGPRYTLLEQLAMIFCGVRGALSLSLALSAPVHMKEIFVTVVTIELLISMICTILWRRIYLNFFVPAT